jgi:hypothetical protein
MEAAREIRYNLEKQDGERKAAQRLLERQREYYKILKATVLEDDL